MRNKTVLLRVQLDVRVTLCSHVSLSQETAVPFKAPLPGTQETMEPQFDRKSLDPVLVVVPVPKKNRWSWGSCFRLPRDCGVCGTVQSLLWQSIHHFSIFQAKCQLLFPTCQNMRIYFIFVIYDSKLNNFDMWTHHFGLWEIIMAYLLTF